VLVTAPAFAAVDMLYGGALLLLAIAVGMPMLLLATIAETRITERSERERERGAIAAMFKLIYISMRFGRKSLLASLGSFEKMFGSGTHIGSLLRELQQRLMLGQKPSEAIYALHADRGMGSELSGIAESYAESGSTIVPFKTLSEKLQNEQKYAASRKEGSLQKYLTLSMLASSVIPSFALFSFVGYSMLAPSGASSFAFMLLITIPIPLAYSVIRAHIDEVCNYYG
ncbi:MAG: hypothetical protein QXR73_03740, partial [Candidatus Micrarchaeaceae archaeon]